MDNDAGGIYTYSLAGSRMRLLAPLDGDAITIALIVVQEMAARMGAVQARDSAISFAGVRLPHHRWLMLALIVTNFSNIVAEFAGVASSLEIFSISRYIVVPLAAALVWVLVVKGTYESIEDLPGGVALLHCLHRRRTARASGLEGRRHRHRQPADRSRPEQLRLCLHGRWSGGHDDRPVDAVLPARRRSSKRRDRQAVLTRRDGT
ncbi:MAG: divalent metal cation transporter [Vicinamibacterales bacterium]